MKLKRRSTVVAAGAAVALLIPATLAFAHGNDRHDDTSLRALASKTGLRIGTAVDAAKLGTDKAYTDIVNDIKVLKVAGGSNEIMRNYIARRVLNDPGHEGLA